MPITNIDDALFAALGPLVEARAYPLEFPQKDGRVIPNWPAIRYTVVSFVPDLTICGDTGEVGTTDVQLDVVASTYTEARELRLAVKTAMQSFPLSATLSSDSVSRDTEARTFDVLMQYRINQSTPAD